MRNRSVRFSLVGVCALSLAAVTAFGQNSLLDYRSGSRQNLRSAPAFASAGGSSFALNQDSEAEEAAAEEQAPEHAAAPYHYREVSDFFNIREAYANLEAGEWEFETSFEWETKSGESDTYGPVFSLKYGFTDTLFGEIEVEQIKLGEGSGVGNGELALILFSECWKETDILPAFGSWIEVRLPTGDGSSGVDGELHFNFTKEIAPNFRGHLGGFIETANGARGGEDEDERRDFQWGVGPGFDYSFSEDTIATVNYLMRCSEEEGHSNLNILELGMAQRIAANQHIKLALDVGLDGGEETPDLAAKVLWSIEW